MLMHRRGNNGVDEHRTCRELNLDSTAYNAIYEINYKNLLITLKPASIILLHFTYTQKWIKIKRTSITVIKSF